MLKPALTVVLLTLSLATSCANLDTGIPASEARVAAWESDSLSALQNEHRRDREGMDKVEYRDADAGHGEKTSIVRLGVLGGISSSAATSEEILSSEVELDYDGSLFGAELGFNIHDNFEIGLRAFRESGDFDTTVRGSSVSAPGGMDYDRTLVEAYVRALLDLDSAGDYRVFFQFGFGGGEIDFTASNVSPSTTQVSFGIGLTADLSERVGLQAMLDTGVAGWKVDGGPTDVDFGQADVRGILGLYFRF